MTELAFTKSFLSALDARPVKLRADYVFDPQSIGLRVPVCSQLPCSPYRYASILKKYHRCKTPD